MTKITITANLQAKLLRESEHVDYPHISCWKYITDLIREKVRDGDIDACKVSLLPKSGYMVVSVDEVFGETTYEWLPPLVPPPWRGNDDTKHILLAISANEQRKFNDNPFLIALHARQRLHAVGVPLIYTWPWTPSTGHLACYYDEDFNEHLFHWWSD